MTRLVCHAFVAAGALRCPVWHLCTDRGELCGPRREYDVGEACSTLPPPERGAVPMCVRCVAAGLRGDGRAATGEEREAGNLDHDPQVTHRALGVDVLRRVAFRGDNTEALQ